MPPKKDAENSPSFSSPFQTADKLLRQDKAKSENEKRFERWVDLMIRGKKLDPHWEDDEDADTRVKWISGKAENLPSKKGKT